MKPNFRPHDWEWGRCKRCGSTDDHASCISDAEVKDRREWEHQAAAAAGLMKRSSKYYTESELVEEMRGQIKESKSFMQWTREKGIYYGHIHKFITGNPGQKTLPTDAVNALGYRKVVLYEKMEKK